MLIKYSGNVRLKIYILLVEINLAIINDLKTFSLFMS